MPDNANPKSFQNLYLMRLLRGDIQLKVTFWVYGVLISSVGLYSLSHFIQRLTFSLAFSGYEWIFHAFNVTVILLSTFIWISIWNSASKYPGLKIWSYLAKSFVLVSLILALMISLNMDAYEKKLTMEVAQMNRGLPIMLGDDMRFDRVHLENRNISYIYTLVNLENQGWDGDLLASIMRKDVLVAVCSEKGTMDALKDGRSIKFEYFDKRQKFITSTTVTESDCSSE